MQHSSLMQMKRPLSYLLFVLLSVHRIVSFVNHGVYRLVNPWLNTGDNYQISAPTLPGRRQQLLMAVSEPDWGSSSPWRVLGINPGSSKKEIKKAYKRLAMQYHPDVSASADKQAASDKFAKINWAYTAALEQQEQVSSYTSTSGSNGGSSSSTWEPPHRRKASSRSTTSSSPYTGGTSTDWRDYMPKYDEDEVYNTDGDSFGKIFTDLFRGAAGGGVGLFTDFVDFFESTYEGEYSAEDPELKVLLQTGSVGEIGDEMDETEMVIQKLTTKLRNSEDELFQLKAEIANASGYSSKMQIQERIDEIEAQRKVVEGYVSKGRRRLLALQTRYKDLIVNDKQDDRKARSSWDEVRKEAASASASKRYTEQRATDPGPSKTAESSSKESWKSEGFGSYGRGRGSSRRRRQQRPSASSTDRQPGTRESTYSSRPQEPQSKRPAYSSRPSTGSTTKQSPSYSTPPHRRPGRSYADKLEDQRRLREIKVDEEFDRLKEDLGL